MQTWLLEEFDDSVNNSDPLVPADMLCDDARDSLGEHNKRHEKSVFSIEFYSLFNNRLKSALQWIWCWQLGWCIIFRSDRHLQFTKKCYNVVKIFILRYTTNTYFNLTFLLSQCCYQPAATFKYHTCRFLLPLIKIFLNYEWTDLNLGRDWWNSNLWWWYKGLPEGIQWDTWVQLSQYLTAWSAIVY